MWNHEQFNTSFHNTIQGMPETMNFTSYIYEKSRNGFLNYANLSYAMIFAIKMFIEVIS